MAKHLGTATFEGFSGEAYSTIVFPLNTKFKEGISAVYLLTKREEGDSGRGHHELYYIGSSTNLRENFKYHEMDFQIKKYKLNAICIIRESDEDMRKKIYQDLVDKHRPLLNEMF